MNPTWIGWRISYLMRVLGLSHAAAADEARRELANASRRGLTLEIPR
jgi:hypothetical protein